MKKKVDGKTGDKCKPEIKFFANLQLFGFSSVKTFKHSYNDQIK